MISLTALFVIAIVVNSSYATRYGVPDNGKHEYAGYLGAPTRDPEINFPACNVPYVYVSCAASLVSIPGFPIGRMVLTARYCVNGTAPGDKIVVHFGEEDKRIGNRATGCNRIVGFNTTGAPIYTASNYWFPAYKSDKVNAAIGGAGEEYALILLDTPVPYKPAFIYDSSSVGRNLNLPVVGVVGYGITGIGTKADGTLGQPVNTPNNRTKMYVELDVISVQNTNILTSMNAATLEEAVCLGDGGAGAIRPFPMDGAYNIYAVNTAVDSHCRAFATMTRVGTPAFWTWVRSIETAVLAKQ